MAALRFFVSNEIAFQRFRTIANWNPSTVVDAVGTGVEIRVVISMVL